MVYQNNVNTAHQNKTNYRLQTLALLVSYTVYLHPVINSRHPLTGHCLSSLERGTGRPLVLGELKTHRIG